MRRLPRTTAALLALASALGACTRADDARGSHAPALPAREPPPAVARPASAPETLPDPREVRFTTSDGVTIAGTLQPGARPDAPLVILVHQLGGDRSEWAPLLERLRQRPAFATLAIDLRGHGESTSAAPAEEGGEARALSWRDFDREAWAETALDVTAARAFVRSAGSGVTPARVGAVGSSIGSTAVIAAAAASEGELDAIVVLSPGRAYHGFDAITPALRLEHTPMLAIVAAEETDSVETAQALARITHGEPIVVDGAAHGVAMLRGSEDALARVEAFLRASLCQPCAEGGGEPGASPPASTGGGAG